MMLNFIDIDYVELCTIDIGEIKTERERESGRRTVAARERVRLMLLPLSLHNT
jgi:hypothetical protein